MINSTTRPEPCGSQFKWILVLRYLEHLRLHVLPEITPEQWAQVKKSPNFSTKDDLDILTPRSFDWFPAGVGLPA